MLEKQTPVFTDVTSAINSADLVWSLEDIKATIHQLIELETLGFTEQQRTLQSKLASLFAKTPKGKRKAEALDPFY